MLNNFIGVYIYFHYTRYKVLLREFSVRHGSGGKGKFHGGDGVIRKIEFLKVF